MARLRKPKIALRKFSFTADRDFSKPQQSPPQVTPLKDRRIKKEKHRKKRAIRPQEDVPAQLEPGFWTPDRNATLFGLLSNLNDEIERARTIFAPEKWFNAASSGEGLPAGTLSSTADFALTNSFTAPPFPASTTTGIASFQSALDSLNYGIQLVDKSGSQLLEGVHVPPFESRAAFSSDSSCEQQLPPKAKKPTKKSRSTPKTSPHFPTDPFETQPTPPGLPFTLEDKGYGLIQERIRNSLYAGVLQTILWNQTTAKAARPVLFKLLTTYPSPEVLATADLDAVRAIIASLGLQNRRAATLIKVAQTWVSAPPCPERRYAKRHYPLQGDNLDVRDGQLLEVDDVRPGWEIAHLPGVGAYALDSFRIFFRDELRGVGEEEGMEPEWRRVVPLDKDLRPYLVWRWTGEGWVWDPVSGERRRLGGC